MNKNRKNGFTLVELLAIIAVLGLILIIAVPKITNTIDSSKKRTLELSVKSIARSAEEAYIENESFGITDEITCESVSSISSDEYESCEISFDSDGNASVTYVGKGSYDGLYVCNGTKTDATAIDESCPVAYGVASTYIKNLLAKESELNNGLSKEIVKYNGIDYDTGIRYVGNDPNNYVYYNCENEDDKGVSYGADNYNYSASCEVWRMLGVFDIKSDIDEIKGTPRVKLVNDVSKFKASYDSSASSGNNLANNGNGINQWGPSGTYEGADLMQLLNEYYIGKENSTCTYCNGRGQEECSQICDTVENTLASQNMKPLTIKAKEMIENAVWDTYATFVENIDPAGSAYLEEKGISHQFTGKNLCEASGGKFCDDTIMRTTSWTGLVGLMSVSDARYSGSWFYRDNNIYPWLITPYANSSNAVGGYWTAGSILNISDVYTQNGVWPTVYLSSNVQIIGGDGSEGNAYKLKA